MSSLKIRRIPFEFDGAPFVWNPKNPGFAILMNQISFLAIGLEKYFCLAFRDAEPLITDPAVREEATLFRAQESIHSQAHRRHVMALIARYPELRQTLDKTIAHYDRLYAEKPLSFHLAYAGGLEAAFTPFFKMILDNRDRLFGGGDPRVASLFIWHFCEEIEHRSSALTVFDHVVGSSWYRLRQIPAFKRHADACVRMIGSDFRAYVRDVPEACYAMNPLDGVSKRDKRHSILGVINSQMPWHDPAAQPLPDYYGEWIGRHEAGEDMTRWHGSRLPLAA